MKFFQRNKEEFCSPMTGKLVPLGQVPDQVFSQKLLGDGFAIEPADGKVYAPLSGTLSVVFPTKHAYGIQTKDGIELLLHLGIDTVELQGAGFRSVVRQGDKVKQGDLLCEMDLQAIQQAGKHTVCPILFTSGEAVSFTADRSVEAKETGIVSYKK